MKDCKYCGSEMKKKAKICPTCKKKQTSAISLVIRIILGILLVIIGIAVIINGTTTNNDDKGCYATMEKFEKIKTKMKYNEVVEIMGCEGTLDTESSVGNTTLKYYHWYSKNGISNIVIGFTNGKVSAKNQTGLK